MPITWTSPNWVTMTSSASSITTTLLYPSTTWTNSTSGWLLTYDMFGNQHTVTGTPTVLPGRTIDEVARERQLAPGLPPEEIAARQQRATRAAETRQAAQTRARDLLLAVLTDTQRAQYLAEETFELIGSAGNRYRINRGSAGNIDYLDPVTAEVRGRLCAHPSMREHWLPDQDVALAQLLALTSDEPSFVRLANVHRGIGPPLPELAASA